MPDHFLGETIAVGISAAKSDHEYNYKTDFEIWGGNQEFERHLFLMNQPPLESTLIGKNTTNAKTSKLDSTPVGT